jgi:osmoprotectant transport system ATP-binding protein
MAGVEIKDVTVQHQQQTVLSGISVRFPAEQITAILGRSGSGKSTLLQLINGLQQPAHGEVWVAGQLLSTRSLQQVRLQTGYAVQGVGLFPHLTVAQNIVLPGKAQHWGAEKQQERLQVLLNQVELPSGFAAKYPHELSGGEQQRVGLCRALFLNPPILLLDEPFGALDPITRQAMQHLVRKMQTTEPRTILLVTHDMREAVNLADWALVINGGTFQQFGKVTEVAHTPANAFFQQLVASSIA